MTTGTRASVCALVLVATAIGTATLSVSAQVRSEDVLPALLGEMKGLRAAVEQMASSATQAQLLVGRLQVQESRVTTMIRRLETVHDDLEMARTEYDMARDTLQALDKQTPSFGAHQAESAEEARWMKKQLAAVKVRVERLTAEEMQLTADIAAEQQRWIAINQRLDELERTLAKR